MPKLLTSDELDLALATDWSAVRGHCEALRLRAEDAVNRAVSLQADLDAAQVRIDALERIIYECVGLTDIMRAGLSEELYRDIVAKFEKAQEE